MRAQVLLPEACIRLEPGGYVTRQVRVRNLGLIPERFTFEIIGGAASWTTLDPPALDLGPDATGAVTVHFHPPRTAHVRAGHMPFGVLTTSAAGTVGPVVECLLEVGSFTETGMELVPVATRRRSATFRVLVANRGNVTMRACLEGSDQAHALRVACVPSRLTVFPGAVAQSHVTVRPVGVHWVGRPRTVPFRVVLTSEDPTAVPAFVTGELLQYPLVPSWPGLLA